MPGARKYPCCCGRCGCRHPRGGGTEWADMSTAWNNGRVPHRGRPWAIDSGKTAHEAPKEGAGVRPRRSPSAEAAQPGAHGGALARSARSGRRISTPLAHTMTRLQWWPGSKHRRRPVGFLVLASIVMPLDFAAFTMVSIILAIREQAFAVAWGEV